MPTPAPNSAPTAPPRIAGADVLVCVQPPANAELAALKPGALLVGLLAPHADAARVPALQAARATAFSLERLPRTTRAQAMDVLSSQAGMAGYKAVLIAAQLAPRFFPMLTTAAGTIRPVEGADRRRRRRRPAGDRHRAPARRAGRGLRRASGNARADRVARREVPRPRRVGGGRGRLRAPAHRRRARRAAAPPGRAPAHRSTSS